jgi:hypothetical protein
MSSASKFRAPLYAKPLSSNQQPILMSPQQHPSDLNNFPTGPGRMNSFADQLPNTEFLDEQINDSIMHGKPPNAETDSEFNRTSSMLGQYKKNIDG